MIARSSSVSDVLPAVSLTFFGTIHLRWTNDRRRLAAANEGHRGGLVACPVVLEEAARARGAILVPVTRADGPSGRHGGPGRGLACLGRHGAAIGGESGEGAYRRGRPGGVRS